MPLHFYSLFEDKVTLEDYLKLDEGIFLYYFQIWQEEEDEVLKDLCCRFINRNLFKYVEFDPAREYKKLAKLSQLFVEAGIDPEYYLEKWRAARAFAGI
jgi:HD superfamily phosphohydrolase